jgi:hypothetical protein
MKLLINISHFCRQIDQPQAIHYQGGKGQTKGLEGQHSIGQTQFEVWLDFF